MVGATCAAQTRPPPPAAPAGQPGFFSLCHPTVLRAALTDAGFAEVTVEPFDLIYQFDSGEQLADWQFAISAPVRARRPERRDQARQAVAAAADSTATRTGQSASHRARTGTRSAATRLRCPPRRAARCSRSEPKHREIAMMFFAVSQNCG